MINWSHIKWFKREEFDDPNYPESGNLIDVTLLFMLDKLRHKTGWPIVPHGAVGGCVDIDGSHGHAKNSYHLASNGARAVDFHFVTDADPRIQYYEISRFGFPGLGIYYDWHWAGKLLPLGFHVDLRPRTMTQRWRRHKGQYLYLLGRWSHEIY
jgi:hypothetical protein